MFQKADDLSYQKVLSTVNDLLQKYFPERPESCILPRDEILRQNSCY